MAKKVIVVDDSRTARQQVAVTLGEAGYDVIEAVDGRDGLQQVSAHPDASLVICDVNMPNMNGLDMLASAKQDGKNANMVFIMLTTEAQTELLHQAKKSGARGWIVKPFKPDMLLAAVKKLVG
jgi:two-component system chemotaxis response regulator CheY